MPKVTCEECSHKTSIGAAADVWVCPECGARHENPGTEDNPPETNPEVNRLRDQIRELELGGSIATEGNSNV